jgi:hypothetical protein
MNKRSAVLIAGALVLAMGLAALAVSLGLTGPAPSVAAQGRATPIVRVERRTVTVHRQAPAPSTAPVVAPSADDHGSDDEWEHEDDDHGHEFEDEFEDD